jgi:hypothetical protein
VYAVSTSCAVLCRAVLCCAAPRDGPRDGPCREEGRGTYGVGAGEGGVAAGRDGEHASELVEAARDLRRVGAGLRGDLRLDGGAPEAVQHLPGHDGEDTRLRVGLLLQHRRHEAERIVGPRLDAGVDDAVERGLQVVPLAVLRDHVLDGTDLVVIPAAPQLREVHALAAGHLWVS